MPTDSAATLSALDRFAPSGHHYPTLVIRLTLVWYLDAHVSLRGVVAILASLIGVVAGQLLRRLPAPQTVRQWLLRVGLYLLQRPWPKRTDWVFILDHTIRLGQRKCLVLVGTSRDRLQQGPVALGHHDVVVLDLWVTTTCTGEDVANRLKHLSQRVGVPQQVVCDHGSDLAKGIRLFAAPVAEQPTPATLVDTYDVTHRLACLVKAQLQPDERWGAWLRQSTQCLFRLQQTAGAFLVPPAPRRLSRYLNVQRHVVWAVEMLAFLQMPDLREIAGLLKMAVEPARTWLEERLGWLRAFREEIRQWEGLIRVVRITQEEVKRHGLSRQSARRVREALEADLLETPQQRAVVAEVLWYLRGEGNKIPRGQTWLGTSDVIESLFGKYKWLGEKAPYAEVGAGVLALPVLTTELTASLLQEALESVSTQDVRDWVSEYVGRSTLSKVRTVSEAVAESQQQPEQDTKAA